MKLWNTIKRFFRKHPQEAKLKLYKSVAWERQLEKLPPIEELRRIRQENIERRKALEENEQ